MKYLSIFFAKPTCRTPETEAFYRKDQKKRRKMTKSFHDLFPEHDEKAPARTALLLSGTGSNAAAILEYSRNNSCAFDVKLLVTDAPETGRARETAQKYQLPLAEVDIYKFYALNGEDNIRLDTPRKRMLRDQWSAKLYEEIMAYNIELVLFAGFLPLTNITGRIPCLNVHPGDLTVTAPDGSRPYAGLHYKPVEDAICDGRTYLRSSVIVAQPYSGNGKDDMDSGPVIGVSVEIPVDIAPETPESLAAVRKKRCGKPQDILRNIAAAHIEKMKINGDHVIFPRAADDFARGRFVCGENNELFFRNGTELIPVVSVEYTQNGRKILERNTL